jgi:uncharacterized membrane protein YtjA (UPF0391 family)
MATPNLRCFYHAKYARAWIVRNRDAGDDEDILTAVKSNSGQEFGTRRLAMLRWTLIFLVVALVAAVFGFGGIAAASAGIARVLFFIFLILFLASLLGGLFRRV